MTIVETAVAASGEPFEFDDQGGDFDILVAAVLTTGATAVLDGATDYTVFAPTDQAFLDLTGAPSEGEAVAALVGGLGVDGILDVLTGRCVTWAGRVASVIRRCPVVSVAASNRDDPRGAGAPTGRPHPRAHGGTRRIGQVHAAAPVAR